MWVDAWPAASDAPRVFYVLSTFNLALGDVG